MASMTRQSCECLTSPILSSTIRSTSLTLSLAEPCKGCDSTDMASTNLWSRFGYPVLSCTRDSSYKAHQSGFLRELDNILN